MRIYPVNLPIGTPTEKVFPGTARYIQLIQMQPTDAARVGLRFRHLPGTMEVDAAGDPLYMDLALGDRIPLPFTDDADGPQGLTVQMAIDYGVGTHQRVVFALGERDDGSDLWLPHARWGEGARARLHFGAGAGPRFQLLQPRSPADDNFGDGHRTVNLPHEIGLVPALRNGRTDTRSCLAVR